MVVWTSNHLNSMWGDQGLPGGKTFTKGNHERWRCGSRDQSKVFCYTSNFISIASRKPTLYETCKTGQLKPYRNTTSLSGSPCECWSWNISVLELCAKVKCKYEVTVLTFGKAHGPFLLFSSHFCGISPKEHCRRWLSCSS